MIQRCLTLLFIVNALIGCYQEEDISASEIQKQIVEDIPEGSTSETIEKYFKSREYPITYDKFTNTYRSLIKEGEGEERKFNIKILLDSKQTLKSVEVRESFTGP